MRSLLAVFAVLFGLTAGSSAQTCTGLACQQMSCPGGGTTTVTGIVYAPNGIDPLPNVLVYIPNAPVAAFTPGVSCPVPGTPPSGSPIAGATTGVDGSFTILNAPVGTNIPLVVVSGRWRRQLVIPSTTACANTALPSAAYSSANPVMPSVSFPQNQSQGDIPKFAIATGSVDSVECVLRKVGISDSEFTDPAGGGRINFFKGDYGGGSIIDSGTTSESTLMANLSTLNNYDVLMLPCEGGNYIRPSAELQNLISFANGGGRVYSSHYAYSWMYQNPPFNTVVNWLGNSGTTYANGTVATVNPAFSGGATLSQWLIDVGASSTATPPAQIALNQIKHDFTSPVNPPTESWLTLDVTGNPVMQFVFDTPVGATSGQCGRVLYNEYHVETPIASGTSSGTTFPAECSSATAALTPQEKLLEYSLFELTNDGGAATLAPTTQDFGSQPLGFASSPAQVFTWTNNSSFPAGVTLLTGSGDFSVVSSNCTSVAAYGTCQISMVYTPSALGPATGTLTVGSNGTTLTAALTGTGVPDLSTTTTSLSFGNGYVGFTLQQSFTVSNAGSGSVPFTVAVTGSSFTTSNSCGNSVPGKGTCQITVSFTPLTLGALTGTVTVNSSGPALPVTLSGTGVPDVTLAAVGLNFGNEDVGFTVKQSVSITNSATGPVQFSLAVTGPYTAVSQCGGTLAAGATCQIVVTFAPTTSGPLPGTLTLLTTVPGTSTSLPGSPATLTGTGVDFSLAENPASGTVIAGDATKTTLTTTPLGGFSAPITLTCMTNAPASTCKLSANTLVPNPSTPVTVTIATTSQYVVVGYGISGNLWLGLIGVAAGLLVYLKRRDAGSLLRSGLVALAVLMLGAASAGLTGCSGKLPAQNAVYTLPTSGPGSATGAGPYSYIITATDGSLVHTATYSLNVTAK